MSFESIILKCPHISTPKSRANMRRERERERVNTASPYICSLRKYGGAKGFGVAVPTKP